MTHLEAFAKQLQVEATATRNILALVPADKLDWQPHTKSMTMRALATHVAELPSWVKVTLTTDELDFETSPYDPPALATGAEFVACFNSYLEEALTSLGQAKEEDLDKTWIMRSGETIYTTSTKYGVLQMSVSQIIHHRAQLGVYLRLLDIPLPGSYGPTADVGF
jgi:uncharacterized damage-inducible protein DinB